MTETQRLQLSIGPVQGFVAQSRRTRDLWASSFLLSHLVATAIESVRSNGGRLVLPHEQALAEQRAHDFGTIPNRFVANFTTTDVDTAKRVAREAANAATACFMNEWRRVADAVRKEFVVDVASNGHEQDTLAIWTRQVEAFWEISWVIGPVEASAGSLAARKNWRTTQATIEPGDHCTMMSDRQELSGWIRSQSRETREKQDEFWKQLRSKLGKLDLGEDERLCAIAFIKRLFPKVAKQLFPKRDMPIEHTGWPSTAYIAAIPWLVAVAECEQTQSAARTYAADVKALPEKWLGERQTKIPQLVKLKAKGATGDFLNLDGNFFQRAAITNSKVTPLEKLPDGQDNQHARRNLQAQLDELSRTVGEKPSAFYALLLMDGDSMGALLGEARKHDFQYGESRASTSLSNFSQRVPQIVGEQLGVTIYAGGDDVLAMLPVNTALSCSMQLADAYRTAFETKLGNSIAKQATLSGAIVYAHYHTPLREVLKTAHHLLDDVAKDATGRDSLAIAVFKSSGITAQWAAPWEHIRDVEPESHTSNIIDALVANLNGRGESRGSLREPTVDRGAIHNNQRLARSAEFSASFLYSVRERFAALTDKALTKPGEFGTLSAELAATENDLLKSVLVADYLRGEQHRSENRTEDRMKSEAERHVQRLQDARAAIDRLLMLSQRVTRERVAGRDRAEFVIKPEPDTLGIDGALVVRFLASEGK